MVHPDFRNCGVGKRLMEARIERVESRLHLGIVENRTAHTFSQRISCQFGFVPVGLVPMKLLLLGRRESVGVFARYFGDALSLRCNHPRIIPEASSLAAYALENCGLPHDTTIDDAAAPYPHDDEFELDELTTEGYSSLLRIERGRLRNRDIFGPIRLHYGLFQLQARHSHYLIASRDKHVKGGIGFMLDEAEKTVRVFELISVADEPIRFLLSALLKKCQTELGVEFIEVDVSAYAPRMQRTLLELGFLPVSYVPANIFHEVERLDAMKMCRVLVPLDVGELHVSEPLRPIADVVMQSFASREVLPRIAAASNQSRLFDSLSGEQRRLLLGICAARCFQPGEPIFRQDETDGTMHLILAGEVELVANETRRLATVSAGQCVGETSLLYASQSRPAHSVSAIAKTSVETAAFPEREFRG